MVFRVRRVKLNTEKKVKVKNNINFYLFIKYFLIIVISVLLIPNMH